MLLCNQLPRSYCAPRTASRRAPTRASASSRTSIFSTRR
jgi:hypothetical protein